MFIELIDSLRCPVNHDDSWLVATIAERSGRDIVAGTLGCPVCHAEYPIRDSVALFGGGVTPLLASSDPYADSDDDAAVRCAALLDLYDPGGIVVLVGRWRRASRALVDLSQVAVLAVDPPPGFALDERVSGIRIGDRLPLAAGAVRGIAIDLGDTPPPLMASAVTALRPRGRLLAPLSAPVPLGITERARDDRHWLGEAEPMTVPVPLTVRRER